MITCDYCGITRADNEPRYAWCHCCGVVREFRIVRPPEPINPAFPVQKWIIKP